MGSWNSEPRLSSRRADSQDPMDHKIELIGERLTFGEDDHAQSLSVEGPSQPDLTLLSWNVHNG